LAVDRAVAEDGGPPTPPDETGRDVLRQGLPAAGIEGAQRRDRAEQPGHGGNAPELEGVQEQRADPPQEGVVRFGERQVVGNVIPGQPLGFRDDGGEPVPGDHLADRGEGVGPGFPGVDQRVAELGQQAHLVVQGPGVVPEVGRGAPLGPPEHPPDQPVEEADGLVGEAGDRVQHRHHQDGVAAERAERPEVLGGQAASLAGELPDPVGVDAVGRRGGDPHLPKMPELVDQARHGPMTGRAGRLAGPG
jgi:hypothetical protein